MDLNLSSSRQSRFIPQQVFFTAAALLANRREKKKHGIICLLKLSQTQSPVYYGVYGMIIFFLDLLDCNFFL